MKKFVLCLLYSTITYCMNNQNEGSVSLTILEKIEEARKNMEKEIGNESASGKVIDLRDQYLQKDLVCTVKSDNNEYSIEFMWRKLETTSIAEEFEKALPHIEDGIYPEPKSGLNFKREVSESETHLIVKAILVHHSVDNQK